MDTKNLIIKNLLKKYGLYSGKISEINYHLNILDYNAEQLVMRLARNGLIVLPQNLSEEVLVKIVLDLILKCDINNPDYDPKIDEEMIRIGMKTDQFYGGHNHNIWANGMFHDDGFGFGTEPTSIYDDYIDSDISKKR